jgi:hypothetical protein
VNQPRTTRDRLDRVFAIVRRTVRFVVPALLVVIVGSGVAIGYGMARQRNFKSETLLLYREGAHPADAAPVPAVTDDPGDRAQRLGVRVKEMVLSRTRLEQIITNSRLYGDIIYDRGMIDAVEELRKHVAFRVQDGDTFALSFEGTNPERVKDVTAKLAEALIADNARTTPEPQPEAKESFDRERDHLDKEQKDKETALAQFLAKHPEFARETARQNAPVRVVRPPQPMRNDSTLATLERETARLQERLDQPVAHARAPEAQADPALVATKQAADAELAKAQKDLTDKQSQFTEEHPDVRAAGVRVKQAQDKVKRAGEAVAASLAASVAAAQQKSAAKEEDEGYIDRGALENQLKRINEEIADYKRRKAENSAPTTVVASSVVALEADWTRLNRELVEARAHVQSLREQERQAALVQSVAATGRTAQMAVIDPPYLPTHEAGISHVQIMTAGIAGSLLLALLLALGLALLDERIYDRTDVERLGMPLLSVVPRPGKGGGGSNDKLVKVG